MTNFKLSVSLGFSITTEAFQAYLCAGYEPEGLSAESTRTLPRWRSAWARYGHDIFVEGRAEAASSRSGLGALRS